jgi:hypothetical protein
MKGGGKSPADSAEVAEEYKYSLPGRCLTDRNISLYYFFRWLHSAGGTFFFASPKKKQKKSPANDYTLPKAFGTGSSYIGLLYYCGFNI